MSDWDESDSPPTIQQYSSNKYSNQDSGQNWESNVKPVSRGRAKPNISNTEGEPACPQSNSQSHDPWDDDDTGSWRKQGTSNSHNDRSSGGYRDRGSDASQDHRSSGTYRGSRGGGDYHNQQGSDGYRNNRGSGGYHNNGGSDNYSNNRGSNGSDNYRNNRGSNGYRNNQGSDDYRDNRSSGNYRDGGRSGDYTDGGSSNYGSNQSYGNSRGNRGGGRGGGRGRDFKHFSNNRADDDDSNQQKATPSVGGLIDWGAVASAAVEVEAEIYGDLPPVIKNLYKEKKEIATMSSKEVYAFRKGNNDITVSSVDGKTDVVIPNPIRSFTDAYGESEEVMALINKQGFQTPSPIQCQLWPILLQGKDVIGIAQTGTGKTLAFLLPGLLHIAAQTQFKNRSYNGPLLLVMAPTRELAQQIQEQAVKFRYKGIRSVCVYGQGDRRAQAKALGSGVEIIVATPGRLIDFVDSGVVDMRSVSYLVLDEADRMLDMGFQPDIIKITSKIRPDRQTVLTSATWPNDVEYIAKRLMKDPLKVQIGDLDLAAVGSVTQTVIVCEEDDKHSMLYDHLSTLDPIDKVIVFCNRKATVDYLAVIMLEQGIQSRVMHGGIDQSDRESALEDMRSGDASVLIATDVASRGLDVKNITQVINLDLPKNLEEYVHRCGRTGRAGATGRVLSFVTWLNRQNAEELIQVLNRTDQIVPDELTRLAERAKRYEEKNPKSNFRGGRGGGRGRY